MSIPMIVANGSSVIPSASPAASTRLVSFLSAMFNCLLHHRLGGSITQLNCTPEWGKLVLCIESVTLPGCLSPAIAACLVMFGASLRSASG